VRAVAVTDEGDPRSESPVHDPGGGAGTGAEANALRRPRARKQVLLRLDPDVHAAVAKWAADDLRSVNAQIEVVLRRALKETGRDPHPAPMRGRGRPRAGE
jgi:hypothetical protein